MRFRRGRRIATDESGFTLTEVLVTIMLMTLVVFAIYAMFEMSLRVFSFGNSTVEASQNARVSVERMEREIRSAWNVGATDCAYDTAVGQVIDNSSTANSITFKNCPTEGAAFSPVTIRYFVDSGVLQRSQNGSAQPLAELGTPAAGGSPLSFRYLDENNNPLTPPSLTSAALVEITLVATDEDRQQRILTNAGLRNAP